jgi:hypothetical protein
MKAKRTDICTSWARNNADKNGSVEAGRLHNLFASVKQSQSVEGGKTVHYIPEQHGNE